MLFLRISLILFTIVQLNSVLAGSPDEFWQEYQTSTQSGKVKSVVEHVMHLSTKLETDTPQRLQHKKSAILWFIATGGKDGFRKTLATSTEREIMVSALVFATILHEIIEPEKTLSIGALHRKAEDRAIKTHLAEAQKVITATRILRYGSFDNLGELTQQLFSKEYIFMALYAKNLKRFSMQQWQQEANEFASIFTLNFDRVAKAVFSNSLKLSIPDGYFGFIEPATETTAEKFRQLVLKNCTLDPEVYPQSQPVVPRLDTAAQPTTLRSMNVVTDSFTVERDATGKTTFQFTKIVKIGCIENYPGSTLTIRETEQTEEEFLSLIRSLAIIENVTYS